jgi:hypothetical protein
MNDRQSAKLNMAQRVSDTLSAYESVYSKIQPMVSAAEELNTNIAHIREMEVEQDSVNIPAVTSKKRAAEAKMIDSTVKIANALYVIGYMTNNQELTGLLGLSPASFYRLEDNTKLSLAKQIYHLAEAQTTTLADYGFDAASIAAIHTTIEDYQALIARPMDAIGSRKQKTTDLKQLFAELDSTLYDRLDKLMVLFKDTHPGFYGEYRTARNYIDTSVRHKKTDRT